MTLFFFLLTADFHNTLFLDKDFIRSLAAFVDFAFFGMTAWLAWRWREDRRKHRAYVTESPEDILAEIKRQVLTDEEQLREAEARLAVIAPPAPVPVPVPTSPLLEELRPLRLQAEILRQTVPAFGSQPVSEAVRQSVSDWEHEVSVALTEKPELKTQFDGASDENPILAALKAHPLSIQLNNRIMVLDAITKYLVETAKD